MLHEKRIGVVVPAYNEEKLIGTVLETMPDFVDRIYIIDDCSSDKTCEKVKSYYRFSDLNGRLELIKHAENQGVGRAIATGYRKALEEGIEVVAVMAGDAQMDPNELEKVVGPIVKGEVDYVKGNRLFTGEAWHMIPRHRYLGNALLSLFTKIASGYWHVADSQTGYTAISNEALHLLPLEKLYPRYGYPNHLLVMLNVYNQRVRDIQIQPVYNIGERSGIKLWRVIPSLMWLLFKCFIWRMREKYIIRDFHPLLFFYSMGFFLFPLGFVFGSYLFVRRILIGPIAETSALFAVFLVIMGLNSLFFAMWFDMEYNKHLR
jgi:glycosyltransferase involved in cell wall biosynthesis